MILEVALTATFYAGQFLGRPTASGEIFVAHKYTAASIDYVVGTPPYNVTVTRGKRKLVVRVNDHCPLRGRIDLSPAAARYLGIDKVGKGRVTVLRHITLPKARSPTR